MKVLMMKRIFSLSSFAVLGIFIAGCAETVEDDPHKGLKNALTAFQQVSEFEKNINKRKFDDASVNLEAIANIYSSSIFSFGSGNFAGKKYDEKATLAMEDLIQTVRVLRVKVRMMKTKRLNREQEAQYQATLEQLLHAPSIIALSHYHKESDFYTPPPRTELRSVKNKLRSLSYRSPDQTKFAAKQMIRQIDKLL
ncbi:MAG: hypothetical protein AAF984_05615 [Verrucomicrobiota bacterium]